MRVPVRYLTGNLAWSASGMPWAIWRVHPVSYAHATDRARHDLHAATTAVLKRLTGEPVLLSLCAQVDAVSVVERMISRIDLDACPAWAETADATLDLLCDLDLSERTHWLAVPLPATPKGQAWRAAASTARSALLEALGFGPAPVTATEVAAATAAANRISGELGGTPELTPATPAELLWIYAHSLLRGLDYPPPAADGPQAHVLNGVLHGPSLASLGQARLTEGGHDDSTSRSPLRRRWLQIETDAGTSYQAFLTLAEMPASFAFPGSEFLASLDGFPFPVDWAARLKIVPNAEAESKSRRKARELAAQVDEYDAETAGVPQALVDAAGDLQDERARLSASTTEVEVQSTTILAVHGATADEADQKAEIVRTTIGSADYQVVRPTGAQKALFTAMLPGTPVPGIIREFTQYQLASDFAMAMPWASADIGDPTGMLLGVSLDGGTARPVLLDLADAPRQDASASLGAVGELGAGKSVLLKSIQIGLLDRGGQVIAVDRTPVGEWATFAQSAAPGRNQVITAGQGAQISLDPLRVFPRGIAARYAKSYLALQLQVAPMSPQGLALSQAVDTAAAADRPCMSRVIDALEDVAAADKGTRRAEHAADLAGLLRVVAGDPLGQMIFAELPAPRLRGDFIVFHTAGLTLPKKEVFASEYHMARQPLEALIGRAILYVIAAVAREVAFADPGQFCGVAFDECYWLTSSTEGQDLVLDIVRDGRKHAAGALLGSHDPEDFGSPVIRGLLSARFLLRHRDSTLAARGLDFLGLDSADPHLLDLVTTGLSPLSDPARKGEALFTDTRRRTGQVKIIIPPLFRIATSILTTPPSQAER
jgi:hypothetical protein